MVWCPGESGDQSVSCVEIGTKVVLETGENSPCSVAWWWNRDKILPAREKWPNFGVFGRAGRVLYRMGQGVGVAGRVLYRLSPGVAVAGRVLYRVSGGLVLEAGGNSPCSVAWCWKREKILPARLKWPDFGVFGRTGRVLYRLGPGAAVAGRVLCRVSLEVGVWGEFCTGRARGRLLPGEFCTG